MESTLDLYRKNFIEIASGLGFSKSTVYEKLNETELANGYCKALDDKDELKRNQYYSALMLRYWYKIFKYKESCKSTRLEDIDYIDWLSDALDIAFQYRDWQNPDKPIFKDPKAVDKIINRCCFSVRGLYYQEFNKDKRKINYLTTSVEDQKEKFGNVSESNIGTYDNNVNIINSVIDIYVKENKLLEAIIVDNISYQDSYKEERITFYTYETPLKANKTKEEDEEEELVKTKNYKYNYSFDKRKLVKNLLHLNDTYFSYFKNNYLYDYNLQKLEEIKIFLKSINSSKLYIIVDSVLQDLKNRVKKII